jgi:hypothetical protein
MQPRQLEMRLDGSRFREHRHDPELGISSAMNDTMPPKRKLLRPKRLA